MEGKAAVVLMLCAFVSCLNAAPEEECPIKQGMQGFDIEKFAGRWYGSIGINATFLVGVKCYQEKFVRINKKERGYQVTDVFILDAKTGAERSYNGTAVLDEKSFEGKLSVVLNPASEVKTIRTDYILNTDYENFAIVVTCTKVYKGCHETSWVLTRRPMIESHHLQRIFDLVKSMGWNLYDLKFIEQSCGALRWTPDEIIKS